MKIKRPMLAASKTPDLTTIKYPKLLSPKIDGIRCIIVGRKALTRTLKPIPNRYVREQLEKYAHDGWDGELVIPGATFNEIQSAIMSYDGKPEVTFCVFDQVAATKYATRLAFLETYNGFFKWFQRVPQHLVNSAAEVEALETKYLAEGYEGVMLRDPAGPYKQGRATLKEEYLLKVKRWEDAEAEVIDAVELQRNVGKQERNELGLAKRSKKKADLVKSGTLGALKVRDLKTGQEFEIGSGFTEAQRDVIWDTPNLRGMILTYKWQPHGVKDKPRFPIFKGFRPELDKPKRASRKRAE